MKHLARAVAGGLVFVAAMAPSRNTQARDLWTDETGDRYVSLNSALKSSLILSTPLYTSAETVSTNFWRLRLDLDSAITPWLTANVAYEQRVTATSSAQVLGTGSALLPQASNLPYRVVPMGGPIIDEPQLLYDQGLDRLSASVRGDFGQVTLGRQAIGFGRSSFFTALDVLAPFGVFQVDTEWKAGVDALNAEWQVGDRVALGFVAAAGPDFSQGAFLGRVQSTLGDVDLLALGGKRSEDWMVGVASSMPVWDAEMHGEGAVFYTDGDGVVSPQMGEDVVFKAVIGGSYSFNVLSGLMFLTEYHFNGFGMNDIPAQQEALLDPDYLARFARGDFQTLGQHEIAANLALTINESLTAYTYAVVSAQDGSGQGALGGTWDYSEAVSLDLSAFAPWGAAPEPLDAMDPGLQSEYGAGSLSVFMSIRVYD